MKIAFINGNIITNNKQFADGFIVEDNIFTYVGNDKNILESVDKKIDLKGYTIMPGFNDSHMHFLGIGYTNTITDLTPTKSIDEIINLLSNMNKDIIIGRGWNQENINNKYIPTKTDLDKISTQIPIIIIRVCGHVAVANSKAIELVGITKLTPQIEGGTFEFETGLFTEDALSLIYNLIPKHTKEDIKEMFLSTEKDLLKLGITSVQSDDFSTLNIEYEIIVDVLKELYESNQLKIRLCEQVNLPQKELLIDYIEKGYQHYKHNKLDFGVLKLLADGSLGGRTAFLREAYSDDTDNCGVPIFTQEQLDELIYIAHSNSIDVGIHAIGDATCEMIIKAIDKSQKLNERNHRHGIIHAQILDETLIKKIKARNIGVYVQPIFLNSDNNIVYSRLGERANHSYLFKTMYQEGIVTAFGSDSPVEDYNPFKNIYCAVTRKSIDGPNFDTYLEEQAFTIEEAIECYTTHSAFFMNKDNLGKFEEGYLADFIVLDKDIFSIKPKEILNAKVLMTVVDGEILYQEKF